MANTCNVLLAVAFLASLSLSAGLVKGDLDIFKDYETHHSTYVAPQFLREKREEIVDSHEKKHDAGFLDEVSDSKTVNDRKTTEEDVKIAEQKSEVKNEEQKKANTSNEVEKDAQDTFMYRNMHDLVQALILADEEDIAMRLQQLHEIENAKESEKLKRQIGSSAAAAAAASSGSVPSLLGVNMWDTVPIDELDAYSCSAEALEFGHFHVSGEIAHELFCEVRKFWHYFLNIGRNFKSQLTLGPLIADDIVADGAFSFLYQLPRIFEAIVSQPRHLLILPEIIHDCVPFPSVFGAIHRLKLVIFKVLRFGKELVLGHIRNLFHHLFLGHRLGVRLLEKLAEFKLNKLQYYGSIIPIERPEIYSQPEFIYSAPAVSTATAAASAASTAGAAAASAASASSSENIALPDYYTSLGEVLNSFRGLYNGYQASGIPHFIRNGVKNVSWTSTVSTVKTFLSRVPFLNSCFGSTPVEEEIVTTTSTASASASTSEVESPVIAPVVAPIAPVIPAESVSTSASASASASSTITEAQPIIYSEPIVPVIPEIAPVVPCQTPVVSSETATAAAAASSAVSSAAASSAAASSPAVISSYRTAPRLYASPFEGATYISPQIAPVEEAVSEASSSSVSVASAASPVASVVPIAQEFAIPSVSVDNAAASAAASASASSAAEEIAPISSVPYGLPYRPRILPPFAPATSSAASASASASSSDSVLTPGQYGGLGSGLNIGRLPISYGIPAGGIPSVISSPAASSAAAASSISGGFNIVLPREKIVNTIGHDYLLPGDVIAITLRNRAVLFGNVLDGTSPITFRFLRPHLRSSLLRNSGRIWKLLARDFRDPECIRQFNNPLLLNYAI